MPQKMAGHCCHPSHKRNFFRVQRQSCKRLVIPQGVLKIYILSPTWAVGGVYLSPVSDELREHDYNT